MTNTETTTRNAELFDGIVEIGDTLTDGRTVTNIFLIGGFRYIVADFICPTHRTPMHHGFPRFCVPCDRGE